MEDLTLLSHELTPDGPFYGGYDSFQREFALQIKNGDGCNQQSWSMNNHVGTHVDCPRHFSLDGKQVWDYKPNEWLFDNVLLLELDIEKEEIISLDKFRKDFEEIPTSVNALLIKTNFEEFRGQKEYWNNNPGLSPELGEWIRKEKPNLKIIGFDFISITSYQNRSLGRIAHKAFLAPTENSEGLRVIEDMKLSELKSSPNKLIVSPMMIQADGSPVTVYSL